MLRITLLVIAVAIPSTSTATGQSVWEENCEGCHGIGVAGAPVAGDADAWRPRLARGTSALYRSALDGRFGRAGTMMPERGGNPDLTDDEVRAAVDHMISLLPDTMTQHENQRRQPSED